jgi:hypothetical protein
MAADRSVLIPTLPVVIRVIRVIGDDPCHP